MTTVRLGAPLVAAMHEHARAAYPDECCGFLLASVPDVGAATIVEVEPAPNTHDGERRRRFLIRAEELTAAERRADGRGLAVRGFYHSHPDHPARPSQYDQDHAWPWYLYLVLSVTPDSVPAMGAFELDPGRGAFRSVPWEATPGP